MQNTILRELINITKLFFPCYGQPQDLFQWKPVTELWKKDVEKLNQVNCEYNVDLEVFFWNTVQIHIWLLWLLWLKQATLAILL